MTEVGESSSQDGIVLQSRTLNFKIRVAIYSSRSDLGREGWKNVYCNRTFAYTVGTKDKKRTNMGFERNKKRGCCVRYVKRYRYRGSVLRRVRLHQH